MPTIKCWHCGATRDIPRPPESSGDTIDLAVSVGMVAYIDWRHSRVLVFCNRQHADQQRTKTGAFRVRPKKAA